MQIIEWDDEGYPTEESLKRLKKTLLGEPISEAINAFYSALKENSWPDCCGLTKAEVRGEVIEVWAYHTGGWSGNEAIISTLSQFPLWSVYLERYDAGGHYYFKPWDEVKKILESEGEKRS